MTSTPPRTIHVPTRRPRRRRRVVLAVVGGLLLLVLVTGAAVLGVTTATGLRSAGSSETVRGVGELVVDVDEGRVVVPPAAYRVSADAVIGTVTVGLPSDPAADRAIDATTVTGPIDVAAR